MSKINWLIKELVDDDMMEVKKMLKVDLRDMVKQLKYDNYRELDDDTLVSIYEQRYSSILKR